MKTATLILVILMTPILVVGVWLISLAAVCWDKIKGRPPPGSWKTKYE